METSRGDAAAATWIFRGEELRRRRGRDVFRGRSAAPRGGGHRRGGNAIPPRVPRRLETTQVRSSTGASASGRSRGTSRRRAAARPSARSTALRRTSKPSSITASKARARRSPASSRAADSRCPPDHAIVGGCARVNSVVSCSCSRWWGAGNVPADLCATGDRMPPDVPWRRVAATPRLRRGHSAETPWLGRLDILWRWVAATPRRGREDSVETSRSDAAAATRTFRGDESRRRRGGDVKIPRRRVGSEGSSMAATLKRRVTRTSPPPRPSSSCRRWRRS